MNNTTLQQQRNAFTAGAVSVSLLWLFTSFWKWWKIPMSYNTNYYTINANDNNNNDDDDKNQHADNDNDDIDEHQEELEFMKLFKRIMSSKSTPDAALQLIYKIIQGTKFMGILPTQIIRERWPWESLHNVNSHDNDHVNIDEGREGSDRHDSNGILIDSDDDDDDKSHNDDQKNDTCIGSIFGLDVGGTLSKLLYFEEKSRHDTSVHYHTPQGQNKFVMKRSSSERPTHSRSKSDYHVLTPRQQIIDRSNNDDPQSGDRLSNIDENTSDNNEHDVNNGFVDPRFIDTPPKSMMTNRTVHSDFTMKTEVRQQALDRFYAFARNLDSYGSNFKDTSRSFYSRSLGGEFHFIQFETQYISQAMDLIKFSNLHLDITKVGATGGGAHKYADRWEKQLGIEIDKQDELESLVTGMQFVLADVVGECYTFQPQERRLSESYESKRTNSIDIQENHSSNAEYNKLEIDAVSNEASDTSTTTSYHTTKSFEASENGSGTVGVPPKTIHGLDQYWWSKKVKRDFIIDDNSYPYLLVMIGTGVSVLRVDGPGQHERISGSTIGGGTYWGLCRLLTDAESFENVLNLAERGDPSKVDMMVGDIYGKNSDALDKLGLTADIVASSFGKLVAKKHPARGLNQEDLARALLLMVTNNIGQVAYLNAKLYNTKRIFFVGNFLRQNILSQKRLSYAINYWSQGKMEALFLEHEGYFGALGAFLLHSNIPHPQSESPGKDTKGFTNRKRSDSF